MKIATQLITNKSMIMNPIKPVNCLMEAHDIRNNFGGMAQDVVFIKENCIQLIVTIVPQWGFEKQTFVGYLEVIRNGTQYPDVVAKGFEGIEKHIYGNDIRTLTGFWKNYLYADRISGRKPELNDIFSYPTYYDNWFNI
jgi:hypothetical protein